MRSLILLFSCTLALTGCGKKGPLIYPDLLVPSPPTSVAVRQSGPGIKLSFVIPDKDRAGQSLKGVAGIKILKRETQPGQEPACKACSDDFKLFKVLYLDKLDINARRYGDFVIIRDSDVSAGRDYGYKVVPFMKNGADGEPSEPASVTMQLAPPPPVIKAVSNPTEILLTFSELPLKEGKFAGYSIYRAVKGEDMPYLPINKTPITGNTFTDSGLKRRVTYNYAARVVVRMANGTLVESALSNEVSGGLTEEE